MNNGTNYVGRVILTTGQVAVQLGVAPRTVSKWFDCNLLKGYRIPGSQDRRFYIQDVIAFAELHGMGNNLLRSMEKRLIFVGMDQSDKIEILEGLLKDWGFIEVQSLFDAGWESGSSQCGVVMANVSHCGRSSTLQLIRNRKSGWGWIVLLPEDDEDGAEFLEAGCLWAGQYSRWLPDDVMNAAMIWMNGTIPKLPRLPTKGRYNKLLDDKSMGNNNGCQRIQESAGGIRQVT